MTSFIDTNVLVRHLTGDPPDLAARLTAHFGAERELLVTDLVAAEMVYVLESFYETPRDRVAEAMRSLVAFNSIICVDPALLLRAIEVYETVRLDFAEAYLVACAESTGDGTVTSFDRSIDRVATIERIAPPREPIAERRFDGSDNGESFRSHRAFSGITPLRSTKGGV